MPRPKNDLMSRMSWYRQKNIANTSVSDCEECGRTGRRLCDVCSGTGEVEHLSVALNGSWLSDGGTWQFRLEFWHRSTCVSALLKVARSSLGAVVKGMRRPAPRHFSPMPG